MQAEALNPLNNSTNKSQAPEDGCINIRNMLNINPLTPNDHYSGRTAPLAPKRSILYIYSTNIGIEYFKHGIYVRFFLLKMQFIS
jgi:hypothetical protein